MDSTEYAMKIDPLHRNVWPVTWRDREIGQVIEHITVTLDLPEPPRTVWSWKLYLDPGDRGDTLASRPRFATHGEALASLARVHRATLANGWSAR